MPVEQCKTSISRKSKNRQNLQQSLVQFFVNYEQEKLPFFIEYNACTSIVHNWNSQWFKKKKLFLFFKKKFTRINPCKFIHHKSPLKLFLSYLQCIVHREYFSIIFNVKKCALYSIKYGIKKYLYLKAIQAKSLPAL